MSRFQMSRRAGLVLLATVALPVQAQTAFKCIDARNQVFFTQYGCPGSRAVGDAIEAYNPKPGGQKSSVRLADPARSSRNSPSSIVVVGKPDDRRNQQLTRRMGKEGYNWDN